MTAATTDIAARSKGVPFDGDLRRALLDAAIRVVATDDPANLSLRAVAREVGVSHAAPKNHFDDKTALLTAIAVQGFERLGSVMTTAMATTDDPVGGLVATGRAYIRFAVDEPGYFRVMWRNELLNDDDPALDAASDLLVEALRNSITSAQATGWNEGRSPDAVAAMMWSTVHGLAQLFLDGPLGEVFDEDIDTLAATVTELIGAGIA